MANLSTTNISAITDKLVALWDAALGTSASGLGLGDGTFGASAKQTDLAAILAAVDDIGQETVLALIALPWPTIEATQVAKAYLAPLFAGFDRLGFAANGLNAEVVDLDSLMRWYNHDNAVSYWQCQAHPAWYDLFEAIKGKAPNPYNLYFQALQGGAYKGTTFTNALGKNSLGAFTPGYAIPSQYAGGLAYLNYTSGTSGQVYTITGFDQDGNSETWTKTLASSGSGNVLLTPTNHAYSLIRSVSAITVTVHTMTGTCYVEAHAPSGRTDPPT